MEIFTLLKANIKHKKGAFKSIIILMFIIALALTTIVSTSGNIRIKLEEAMDEADVGDLVATIDDARLTEKLKHAVESDSIVDRSSDIKVLEPTAPKVNSRNIIQFLLCAGESARKFWVFNDAQGGLLDDPAPLEAGEIYVPLSFQALYDCNPGDDMSFTANGQIEHFKIRGFIQEPYIGAFVVDSKLVFLSDSDYDRILGERTAAHSDNDTMEDASDYDVRIHHLYNVFQKEDSKLTAAQLKRELNQHTKLIDYSGATLSKEDSMGYTTMFTDIFSGMLIAFVVLLTAIMLIVMGHSISTGIEMEYANLGILKSLGFTKGKLRMVLGLQYMLAEFIGAVCGVLAAIPCVKALGTVFQPITGILAAPDIDYPVCIGLIVLILVICNAFVYIKTLKVSKISPIRAINGGHEVVYFDNRIRLRLGEKALTFRLAMRQLFTGARQYAGLVIIASILVYFMMAVTTLATCMTPTALQENFGAVLSNVTLIINEEFENDKIDDIERSISTITPVSQSTYASGENYSLDGTEYYGRAFYEPEDFLSVIDGRPPLYDNEIIITEIVAGELNKNIGDTVTVSKADMDESFIISGLYQSTNDAGRCFGMSLAASGRFGNGKPCRGYISLEDTTKITEVVDVLNTTYSDILKAEKTSSNGSLVELIQISLDVVSAIIYIISGLFALIVVSMVCGRTFIKERHDIGIYKAIGFTSASLRIQFVARFVIVAFLGACLGALIYVSVNDMLMSRMFSAMGISQFVTEYHLVTLLIPLVFICACFCVFSMISTRKVKRTVCRNIVSE